jgi:hypothetical protein
MDMNANLAPNNASFVFVFFTVDPKQLLSALHRGLSLPLATKAVENDGEFFLLMPYWMLKQ